VRRAPKKTARIRQIEAGNSVVRARDRGPRKFLDAPREIARERAAHAREAVNAASNHAREPQHREPRERAASPDP